MTEPSTADDVPEADVSTAGTENRRFALVIAPGATNTVRPVRMRNWQPGVDAFFRSVVATYTTPNDVPKGSISTTVFVAPTFMMHPWPDQHDFMAKGPKRKEMLQIAMGAGISGSALDRIQQGRGTPVEIRTLVQAVVNAQSGSIALINTQSPTWQPLDVRRLMHQHAIGLDCAGYVQQAYLGATGRTRQELGWDTLGNEGLFNLGGHGFKRFQQVADLRPGDVIVFNSTKQGEPGHRTIVFDQRVATNDDTSALRSATHGKDFATDGPLRVIEMDSSYGAGGHYYLGGVQRQKWFFNGKKWGHLMLASSGDPEQEGTSEQDPEMLNRSPPYLAVTDGLYGPDDKVEGFYRLRADG